MSEAVSALNGAEMQGIVTLRELGLQGMVTLRADLSAKPVAAAVKSVTGATLPAPRRIETGQSGTVAWMAPDELLILCPHDAAERVVAALTDALAGQHHLAVNVSDARAMFDLTGDPGALRDVLAKIAPADLSPEALPVGELRRTRLQQVPAALWFAEEGKAQVICFRSVAEYVFGLLSLSAKPGGEVGFH